MIEELLKILALIITPDWGALIVLLPLLIAPLVLLWFLATGGGWGVVALTKRRAQLRFADATPTPPQRDAEGRPLYPAGRPYDPRAAALYPVGATRSNSGEPLLLGCPGCSAVRLAEVTACAACGMEIRVRPRVQIERPAGPPPGGAARA
jgi:hypothetical protein